jgi:hypothetical protein
MAFTLETFTSLQEIAPLYDPLFNQAGRRSVFCSRAWFNLLASHGFEQLPTIWVLGVRDGDAPALLLILKDDRQSDRDLSSLSNYYSMDFAPLISAALSPVDLQLVLSLTSQHLAAHQTDWSTLRIHPLPEDSPFLDSMTKAFADNGIHLQAQPCDTNWFADIHDTHPQAFRDNLPAKLDNTLRRKEKAAAAAGDISLRFISTPGDLTLGIADYLSIYQRSWKPTEPDPHFVPQFMRLCADNDTLRLGILQLNGKPVAAQFWIVENDTALLYKLAHDPAYDHLSVGTLLNWHMIKEILDRDQPKRLSFGLGNETFKQSWMPQHKTMVSLVAHNRRNLKGLYRAWRQKLGLVLGR